MSTTPADRPSTDGRGISRRTVLTAAAGTGAAVALSVAVGEPAAAAPKLRVYVLVIDGCRPDELTPLLTPRLAALRSAGMNFPSARSLPIMETIPNHVMMMSGVRPDRSSVPANSIYDRGEKAVRTLERSSDLRFPTLLERLRSRGHRTGSVLSKDYLYGIFGTRASVRWEPFPLIPITEHAPDAATIDALIAMVDDHDPALVFANFGDIDRFGHSDVTGTTVQAARRLALADTDAQIGRFIDRLQETGKWSNSVLMVLADHSMDWSLPTALISVTQILRTRPDLSSRIAIAQNGGADMLYWTGSSATKSAGLAEVRRLVTAHPGVLSVQTPGQLRLGDRAGDLIAYCKQGWRFSDPEILSNPIPGNHGHPVTEPIPFYFGGGSPRIKRGTSSSPARTVDIAPTVGSLFGLPAPSGGYDGTSRAGAFR